MIFRDQLFYFYLQLHIGRDGQKGEIGGRCQGCRPGEKGIKGEPGLHGNPGLQVIRYIL